MNETDRNIDGGYFPLGKMLLKYKLLTHLNFHFVARYFIYVVLYYKVKSYKIHHEMCLKLGGKWGTK